MPATSSFGSATPADQICWVFKGSLLPPPSKTTEESSPLSSQSSESEYSKSSSMAGTEIDYSKNLNKVIEELNLLSQQMGMPIKQENGQRRFGPPEDCKTVPPKGCEVFVGKLPRDCFETELVPVFEKVGKIYEMRLMMDFSGTNRGYCFVQYFLPSHALAACKDLNHYEIRKGRAIGVVKSVDNCRLFIGGIPKDKTEQDIFTEVARVTDGVVRVIAYPSVMDKTKNRGFAFVEYENHKAAAMARRKMIPGKTPMWGVTMCVDWAEPEPDVDSEIMSKVQILYVRNLMMTTAEETLAELFNGASDKGVERVKKIKDYAFIHFITREKAEIAKTIMQGKVIDGSRIDITWSKPVDKNIHKAQKALSRSLYPPGGLTNGSVSGTHFSYTNNQGRGIIMDGAGQYGFHPMSHHAVLNQMDGVHYLTPQIQMIPGYALNNGVAIRNNRNRQSRSRAAAGVQGMRLPSQHNLITSQSPLGNENAYEMIPYLGTPGLIQDQMYYPPYSAIVAPNTSSQPMYGI